MRACVRACVRASNGKLWWGRGFTNLEFPDRMQTFMGDGSWGQKKIFFNRILIREQQIKNQGRVFRSRGCGGWPGHVCMRAMLCHDMLCYEGMLFYAMHACYVYMHAMHARICP